MIGLKLFLYIITIKTPVRFESNYDRIETIPDFLATAFMIRFESNYDRIETYEYLA